MTAQTNDPTPIRTLDDDVATYLDLTDRITQLEEQRNSVKARLAAAGPGAHPTSHGVTVSITPPPRRFNLDRAWTALTPEQQALCTSPDPKKVKSQLPEVLLDTFMDEGTGAPRVSIR